MHMFNKIIAFSFPNPLSMNPSEWNKLFLSGRNLSVPSGKPLYSYKIAIKEFVTLADVLKNNGPWSSDWDCCFVLYATEWWRKFYEGSNWSWEPILKAINKANLSVADRNQLVSSGFKKWKRTINENLKGSDYIGTVVLECGLPLRVLESEHYLTDLLKDLYQELGAISTVETQYNEVVKSVSATHRLPQTLQKDAFFHLLLQFITELVALNEKYGFSNVDKPVEKLDQLDINWRSRFPLRIEGTASKNFIDQLLAGVIKDQPYEPAHIRVSHELIQHAGGWKLKTMLNIQAGFYKLPALGISNAEFEALSNKLEIYTGTPTGDQRIGFAFKSHDQQQLQFDPIKHYPLAGSASGRRELYLLDPKSYRKLPLPTAGIDISEYSEPFVFSALDDVNPEKGWELIAVGTVRLKRGTYRVLTTEDAILTPGIWKTLMQMTIDGTLFTLYEGGSDLHIQQNDNDFYLSFSADAESFSYELVPPLNGFEFYREENKAIYKGWPKIYKIRADGAVIGKVGSALEYNNNGRWTRWTPDVFGKTRVRLTSGSSVLFCKTVQVLPPNFSVEFNLPEKTVHLLHSSAFSITIYTGTQTRLQTNTGGHDIYFTEPENLLPDFFEIGLTPKHSGTDKILLRLPCPKQQLQFYSPSKERLPYKASLYLHDLYGTRLYISNLLSFPVSYRLRLKLLDSDQPEDSSVFRTLKVPAYGNIELALVNLKESMLSLLAISTNIDAKILVSCDDRAAIEIRQYEFKLEKVEDGGILMRSRQKDLPPFDLQAFPLDEPFSPEKVVTLNYLPVSQRWQLPRSKGTWFIYPAPGIKEQFRPLAYYFENNSDGTPIETATICRLHQVAVLEKGDRLPLLDKILDQMAVNCEHPDWSELCSLYKSLQHLPLNCQDIFSRLGSHQNAMMMGVLILPIELVIRMTEEFAIIWSRYPIQSWITTFQCYYSSLHKVAPAFSEHTIQLKQKWIGQHLGLTSLTWLTNQLLFPDQMETPPFITLDLARFLLDEYLHGGEQRPGLRARHLDEKWPTHLNSDIANLFRAVPKAIRELLPAELAPYQKGVLYLPFVLAAASVQPDVIRMPTFTAAYKFRIQEVIDFDEEWFIKVYDLIQGYLLKELTLAIK